MIKSFNDKETEKVFNRTYSKKLPETIQQRALRKLRMIDAAAAINDLRVPPGNRLEALEEIEKASIAYESIINGTSVLPGTGVMRLILRLLIIIKQNPIKPVP